MRIEVRVPNLPESVSDATLLDWHHRSGEAVTKDSPLIDLETDKVILEVPVPESGILQDVRHEKGDLVMSGDLLAVIDTAAVEAPVVLAAKMEATETPETAIPATAGKVSSLVLGQPMSPAVRRLLNEHQLRPEDIPVSGRITKQDVLDFLAQRDSKPAAAPRDAASATAPGSQRPGERRAPMTKIRSRIAERMVEAQHNTATLTTFNEVNLQRIYDLRNAHRARFEQIHGVKLGLMSFFVKACVEALKRFPILNASVDGNDIVYHDYYDIGIAVTTDRGLVVPVLRDADQKGFSDIERAINDYGARGRDGKLAYEELTGGTFTITNGGIFGSMLSTPILNPPQSAILGMHAIKERPVVEEGAIVIRPIIYLALSYDHRLIDGRDAVSFLFTVKELLEDPSRLLLSV